MSAEGKSAGSGGYEGRSSKMLSEKGISIGDTIKLRTSNGQEVNGILMPRYELADENHIVIKLKTGYNIGIKTSNIQSIGKIITSLSKNIPTNQHVISSIYQRTEIPVGKSIENDKDHAREVSLPKIALIGTGGTIASKIDYRTGGVHAAISAADLYASIPELGSYASIDTELVLNEFSENLKPEHWTLIANKIAEKIRSGRYSGIIVSHGTDTMHYTASALSFALQNPPVPVVLVGAQRSSDRPSSDAAVNIMGATIFCLKSEYSGVFVAMHAGLSDDIVACHIGTRVRKNHTSRRDAFESIDMAPIALIKGDILQMHLRDQPQVKLNQRNNNNLDFTAKPDYDRRVILIKYYPGFNPRVLTTINANHEYKAIILEGTGLGHVSRECISEIEKLTKSGIIVFMTSQCIWGRTGLAVYDTGRDLLKTGVIPLSDMLPETATVKAMWALANSKDTESFKTTMQYCIANETSTFTPLRDNCNLMKELLRQ